MKRNSAIIFGIFFFTAIVAGCSVSKLQDKNGLITLRIGSVKIQREGGQTIEAQISEQVRRGDTIITGKNSTAVVQFSDNFVIQVEEASVLKVKSSMEENREMFVPEGQVLAKLVKTGKNNASISTPTSVAAVRGTQFSVKYREGTSTVAVVEGTVAVKAVRAEDAGKPSVEPARETLAEAGKTAEVVSRPGADGESATPLALNMRPISDTEKKELKKIEAVPVIPEAEKKDSATIEARVKEAIGQAREKEEGLHQDKVKALMEKKTRSIAEIREVFSRIDEITLYNGRVIQGAVMSRGDVYTILTPGGIITIPEKQIKGSRILK